MANQDYSLNKLAKDTGMSENTMRPIKNNTMPNPELNTLIIKLLKIKILSQLHLMK